MLENLTKYAGLIPLAAIIIYILGYITLNSYLQSYGINEVIGLDFNILRLGVLLAIIIGPIILLAYSTFKFGDYSNAEPDVSEDVINTLHDVLGYTVMYSVSLGILLFRFSLDLSTYLMIGFLAVGFILNKIKFKYIKLLKGSFLLLPFLTFCFLGLCVPVTEKISLYFLQLAIFSTCASLRVMNKEGMTYQISKVGIIVTTICYCATLFGVFIIPKIPAQYGGEKRSPSIYYLNTTEIDRIKNTGLKEYIKNSNAINLEEVYVTTDKYYFKTLKKQVFSVPKSYFTIEEIAMPNGYPR